MPEFGSWMVEAVPSKPYNSLMDASDLLSVVEKLHHRRDTLDAFFGEYGLQITSMANAGSLGTKDHIYIENEEFRNKVSENADNLSSLNPASASKFVLDNTINTHPRFAGLVKSIRERRGEKVDIRVPIYQDINTNLTDPTDREPYPGFIYMDAMHFGMG
jgi:glutamate--cysteine ligase catalytic subunit